MATVVPTSRFWALLALGVPIALLGVAWPGFERLLWPYNLLLFGLFALSAWYSRRTVPLTVARRVDTVLSVRQPNRVTLTVENHGDQELALHVREEVPENCRADRQEFALRLEPGEVQRLEYDLVPYRRGSAEFPATFVRYPAPFGLALLQRRLETRQPVRVYPNVKAVRDLELLRQRGHLLQAGVRKTRRRGLGTEFESLRDYNEDDFRFIDWKSTSRRGRLVVKQFEQERNQAIFIAVDVGRHMLGEVEGVTKLDHCLDAALMLMHTADRSGDQVGLLVFAESVRRYVGPKRGRAHVAALLEAVHAVHADPLQPDYAAAFAHLTSRWKRRSLVVVFTDAENDDQARELAEALAHVRRRHRLMVVRVADPRLKQLREAQVSDERALFSRAAATWYHSDRLKADLVLRAANIESLESEPQALAETLVERYLALKERAAI